MGNVDGGPGLLSRNSVADVSWSDYAGFLAGLTGTALPGPSGVGVNVIDVTALIQEQVNGGAATGINVFHYPGVSYNDAHSIMNLLASPNVPTLYIDYDTP